MTKAILRITEGRAFLHFRNVIIPALIGASGIRLDKREGDHATPVGELPLRRILYRADRVEKPVSGAGLPIEPIAASDGWCDDGSHPDYNRPVTLPHPASCEKMCRDDHVYDLCIVMGWNDVTIESGRGSAIFLHLPPASGVTEGCIALQEKDLRYVLEQGLTAVVVEAP
ncbi:L,D-transpeptidase family protein [Gluconobacter cerinus]|nr:L,D-transpeptidase family protein [Gluconobacter cerinus]GBR03450.1 hypothetical protein AA0229_1953 [Gluconobacter cerinus NRIC 0229]